MKSGQGTALGIVRRYRRSRNDSTPSMLRRYFARVTYRLGGRAAFDWSVREGFQFPDPFPCDREPHTIFAPLSADCRPCQSPPRRNTHSPCHQATQYVRYGAQSLSELAPSVRSTELKVAIMLMSCYFANEVVHRVRAFHGLTRTLLNYDGLVAD